MSKILIIEDEEAIADLEKDYLELNDFEVSIENTGDKGLKTALSEEFDLIILDLMLPGMDGFEICKRLKREKQSPIIMLSAKDSVMDKVNGLQIGADDYIAKPFAIEELLARIEVVFRRQDNLNNYIIKFKDITINKSSRVVKRNGNEINLTNKEYELLMILIDNKGKVVTREELLEKVWGYGYEPETNVTDVYVRYLRSKLNNENKEEYIQTIRSVGYIMRS